LTARVLLETSLERNLARLRRRIAAAAEEAGRAAGEVELVAVTKTVDSRVAAELLRLGQRDLGENRASELERKAAQLAAGGLGARWHFIGHVQRNKARRVVQHADVIHSVDSLRLLETLERTAEELGRRPGVYVQLHLTPEIEKTGIDASELDEVLARLAGMRHLEPLGLMAMGPREESRACGAEDVFARLAALARARDGRPPFVERRCRLSMGMSGDFELAIAHGSDVVRVGSALFEGVEGLEVAG